MFIATKEKHTSAARKEKSTQTPHHLWREYWIRKQKMELTVWDTLFTPYSDQNFSVPEVPPLWNSGINIIFP